MQAPIFHGRRVQKPWGYELVWAETERYAGKTLHVERGHALSLQYHLRKDETLCLLSGEIELHYGDGEPLEVVRLRPGDSFRIRPGLWHRLVALETSDILEASSPELDDVVRVDDRYGRTGSSAP
jgi:mannose-6-phosphate isomerase-like protein (cupin superfamily)